MKSLTCNDEAARLEVLRQYQILDTSPEQAFDDLVFLAAQICGTAIALINLIDANRQWFKAKVGLDVDEMPINLGFAPLCMHLGDILIIPDTLADERFATNPVVTSYPYVRFYAGIPLITPEGEAIGVLCIADRQKREISLEQVEALQAISRQIVRQLEIRRNLAELASIKTDYQQAQEALQQSESTLSSFFDSAPMMMGIVELVDDEILHISDNAATAKFFGVTPAQMQNYLANNISLSPKYVQDWIHYYRQAQRTQSPINFEYPHDTPKGKKWLRATVSAIAGSSLRRPRFAYIIEDITKRKQAEEQVCWKEALLRSMTSVSPLAFYVVDNCTDNILYFNDRFCEIWGIEHLKEQMEHCQLKNHDIIPDCLKLIVDTPAFTESCPPLQSEENRCVVEDEIPFTDGRIIRRFSTQVRDEYDKYFGPKCYDERTLSMLAIVESNAKRGANLVKQVLSFVRGIEGDRTVLQVKHLILEMKQIVEQTFPKSIAVHTEIPIDLWHVCGDSTQLHQVLMNLCLNARDAMPEYGSLKISAKNIFIDENYAKMHLDAQLGSYIILNISDTGVGINHEQLDRIFEPFFTTKEFGKGTGLGLSIVMGIIKGHGGFITVSSSLGKGTLFQVYLPAVQAETIQPVEEVEIITGYGELILVVDDEASVRDITKASLENNNYRAITANDGIEAIAVYAQHKDKISAAIIDMMMPNMDGATTISTLQKMNPHLRIVAVSGLATSEQVKPHKASKLTAFLPKPYTAQELLKTLYTVISQ